MTKKPYLKSWTFWLSTNFWQQNFDSTTLVPDSFLFYIIELFDTNLRRVYKKIVPMISFSCLIPANETLWQKTTFNTDSVSNRSSVLYTNPWDSIVTLIKILWGICWFTLYLSNLCNSLLHQTIMMASFIRSLIYLKVCCCAATSHHMGWTAELSM